MKKFIVILTVVAALTACGVEYEIEVRNNSLCSISAVISDGTTRRLAPGESDEIDKWDSVKSFIATPARASMRMSGDDYEFYDPADKS
jgi:hypothetical protein